MRRTLIAAIAVAACGFASAEDRRQDEGAGSVRGVQRSHAEQLAAETSQAPTSQDKSGANDGAATGSGRKVGAQDVTATGNAHISRDNAAQIANALMATARPRHTELHVDVGAPLPGDIDVEPLPTAVVDLVPEYKDYNYVVVNDEIVIVQPSTRKVVEVINENGG